MKAKTTQTPQQEFYEKYGVSKVQGREWFYDLYMMGYNGDTPPTIDAERHWSYIEGQKLKDTENVIAKIKANHIADIGKKE